jgi:hypothetical protein
MIRRFFSGCAVPAALFAGLLAGCHTQDIRQVGERPREEITDAALAKYPGSAHESDRARAVTIADPDRKQMDIYNLGNQPITATAVWVNGEFVKRISTISPKSHVTIPYVELLQAGPSAKSLSELDRTVQKVELQTNDGTYIVQGPVNR